MTAIAGLFALRPGLDPERREVTDPMLSAFRTPDHARQEYREPPAWVGRLQPTWVTEVTPGRSGALEPEPGIVVAADAALYYREDLGQALERAVAPATGSSAEHLIAAAYRAWGAQCASHLEGDFSFILWDAHRQRAVCARDFSGRRPLFYHADGRGLAVASALEPLLGHPAIDAELNLAEIAASAAGLYGSREETVWRGLLRLPAGHTLVWEDGETTTRAHWTLAPAETGTAPSMAEAAEELRHLLGVAIRERAGDQARTTVWLSGGWDSSAVFAAGRASGIDVRPVSASYPEGDPAREDDLIRLAAARWAVAPTWVEADGIPLLDRPLEEVTSRAEPLAHAYDGFNRALARATRRLGARVALDGFGGDQLFQVSPVYLADLLRQGRLLDLAREWRGSPVHAGGWSALRSWVIRPYLHALLGDGRLSRRLGRHAYLDRFLPPWMDEAFVRRHALREREMEGVPKRRRGESFAAYEMRWYLEYPYAARTLEMLARLTRSEGVELRSPLYDRRIIELAARRPVEERDHLRETKRLLRSAMAPWLPAEFLAPRRHHTGVPTAYFNRTLRRRYGATLDAAFQQPVLAELGIVDAGRLRASLRAFLAGKGDGSSYHLLHTLLAERWAASRIGRSVETL